MTTPHNRRMAREKALRLSSEMLPMSQQILCAVEIGGRTNAFTRLDRANIIHRLSQCIKHLEAADEEERNAA